MCDRISLPEMTDLWQKTMNWQPNEQQQQQFQQLYELILVGNNQFNLTRITEPTEFWEKHLWDSLRGILPLLENKQDTAVKAIDIGTGAGFPGIPIAISLPATTVTLLDSTRKKITFLDTVIEQLNISNVQTLTFRAEILSKQPEHRQTYDLATIRAVGSAAICAEYTLPLLKSGGLAVLYRGNWTEEEKISLQSTVEKLDGEVASIDSFTTPLSQSVRHCINLKKL
ncbi:16S rRNA (guanine(527)-N(7))-methyltransferase RsmG [Aliterella atlantica]|uniref:Ribosomal RNA small subunit methyltransferase G n=1 Tax=Aliterella atlantica CENA595 TaxID=1618023 RepID=A0A0D8ZPU8_9CYAN|nr:16S rRNA (guanine(527)-N(7))-methyltransferase RsmG [Aliterella atlantica]KJH70372.1 16S rRNA methyltransferase [Aliterella atlantica CENA595]